MAKAPSNLLLVFTKNPQLGTVKTRLAAKIGDENALLVHEALVGNTLQQVQKSTCDKVVYFSSQLEVASPFRAHGFRQEIQAGDDLGERMKHAFSSEFPRGYTSIVIIGTDCPELDDCTISRAFELLEKKDVVIGPANDGGYYLLGLNGFHSELFDGIAWSTSTVFQSTIDKINRFELSVAFTPEMCDIDTFEDLKTSEFGKEHFPQLLVQ